MEKKKMEKKRTIDKLKLENEQKDAYEPIYEINIDESTDENIFQDIEVPLQSFDIDPREMELLQEQLEEDENNEIDTTNDKPIEEKNEKTDPPPVFSYKTRQKSSKEIEFSEKMKFFTEENYEEALDWIHPDVNDLQSLKDSSVLTALKKTNDAINEYYLNKLNTQLFTLNASEVAKNYKKLPSLITPDYLKNYTDSGVPPHELKLKIGCLCIITRNLDQEEGLMNGTKVIIRDIYEKTIKVQKIEDINNLEKYYLIPRIKFELNIVDTPIGIYRRQFPLKLCYSQTINKSQGQTLKRVLLDLRTPCFAHGQLYVALTRVKGFEHIRILTKDSNINPVNNCVRTQNVVYDELLCEEMVETPEENNLEEHKNLLESVLKINIYFKKKNNAQFIFNEFNNFFLEAEKYSKNNFFELLSSLENYKILDNEIIVGNYEDDKVRRDNMKLLDFEIQGFNIEPNIQKPQKKQLNISNTKVLSQVKRTILSVFRKYCNLISIYINTPQKNTVKYKKKDETGNLIEILNQINKKLEEQKIERLYPRILRKIVNNDKSIDPLGDYVIFDDTIFITKNEHYDPNQTTFSSTKNQELQY